MMKSDRFILFEYFKEQQQQKSPHPKDKNKQKKQLADRKSSKAEGP